MPFTNKTGTELPLSLLFCCFMAQKAGKEKNVFVWSIHPPFRSWNPHPSVMTWPHCYIPGTVLLGEKGPPGCCCMSDRVGRQTKMDLKLLLLAQEGKNLNKWAKGCLMVLVQSMAIAAVIESALKQAGEW